ncbi:hypothetical protein [Butyrivibrio proteoclasticus]|nr:hypothetical protein [Butyrivibrio proteoclasticus]
MNDEIKEHAEKYEEALIKIVGMQGKVDIEDDEKKTTWSYLRRNLE